MKIRVGQIYMNKDKSDRFEIIFIIVKANLIITGPNLLNNLYGANIDMNLNTFEKMISEGTYLFVRYNIFPNSYGRLLNLFL